MILLMVIFQFCLHLYKYYTLFAKTKNDYTCQHPILLISKQPFSLGISHQINIIYFRWYHKRKQVFFFIIFFQTKIVSIGFVQRASRVALRPSLARSPLSTLELEDDTPVRAPSATDAIRSPRQTPPQQL